ncbi:Urease accessory protein UreE [hydrothermal vent metagenome]|uniref:Urease accessory protein UreE n=1 Tax=hydrothermal vent metagenome TaxID=652676 RepID=A0A3B1BJI4_9ZZZZ
MIELTQILDKNLDAEASLTLPIEQRVRSRLRVTLDDGRDAGLFLPRGALLRGGDRLGSDDGLVIAILAANETVSTVHTDDSILLTRAAYHLGNRHIPLQVEKGWLRYLHDHVLDEMLQQMDLEVVVEQAPFEPEAGAYQQAAHQHTHQHSHSHQHD